MKAVQVSDYDLLGNKFNGYDLHLMLKNKGIDSYHLTINKDSDSNTTCLLNDAKTLNHLKQTLDQIQSQYLISSFLCSFSFDILYNEHFLNSDIVNYQIIEN